ncbi:hypothetical protein CYMTET_55155 [Cymbomonas tetramitiformis]|uniref:Uncharacterized protein n=1 Tax=Cymbomonas tetramitiformis TaxID=36881 RepID=A0AAE0BFB5_9CHLO|nr:hypothetical protein CYMTET_55155 [Cymbomonas tetramitiformis]
MPRNSESRLWYVYEKARAEPLISAQKESTRKESTRLMTLVERANASSTGNLVHELTNPELSSEIKQIAGALKQVMKLLNVRTLTGCFGKNKPQTASTKGIHLAVLDKMEMLHARLEALREDMRQRRRVKTGAEKLTLSPETDVTAQDLRDLQLFQQNRKFGPRSGMRPSERYARAVKFELDPPSNIPKILEKNPDVLDARVQL